MPVIFKKCFLFHYDPTINSDKVFNVFVVDNENGTFSAISEFGRSGTKLTIKPLIENCSLKVAESRFSAKINEKVYHSRTPYSHTLNPSTSPTYQKLIVEAKDSQPVKSAAAKIPDFTPGNSFPAAENESGGQISDQQEAQPAKKIGILNLNGLDALEI